MPDAPASAAERLERLPLSPYHRLVFVIIALAFFFDSMDLAMMTFLLGSIKAEFGLDSAQAGLLASSSFFGMVIARRRPLRRADNRLLLSAAPALDGG